MGYGSIYFLLEDEKSVVFYTCERRAGYPLFSPCYRKLTQQKVDKHLEETPDAFLVSLFLKFQSF